MASEAVIAIRDSRPPVTDPITYLTILESHLSPAILPELNEILQDAELTQSIGWDLIHLLIALPGAEHCLTTISRLGNPREVILQVTEAVRLLHVDDAADAEAQNGDEETGDVTEGENGTGSESPTDTDKFCLLVSLLAILHPRIKTKYPSRFLSTSLMAILSAYRPASQTTEAIIAFVHAVSHTRRPPLPHRTSSTASPGNLLSTTATDATTAPDPEASAEDPQEAAIQKKLLQSFVTHTLEEYVNSNELEWAGRLQEHFEPTKIVPGRKSIIDSFRDDLVLKERDLVVGQLVALSRDLGLSGHESLLDAINATVPDDEDGEDEEETNYPSSPNDVPLSKPGCLFLLTSTIFSSVMFDTNVPLPPFTIFPDHERLVKEFIGVGPQKVDREETGVIDAILAIGLWLENTNKFVSGPLEDDDFLQHIQTLSILSAGTPSPTLRYQAHVLTSSILHAHPSDRTRLSFISDTLENCPFDNLRASAITWLKEEIITAHERKSQNVFSSTVALSSTQPYIFPDLSSLVESSDSEALEEVMQKFPFHMTVLNFLLFVKGEGYSHVVPGGMISVVEQIYLEPLQSVLRSLETALAEKGALRKDLGEEDSTDILKEIQLLSERLSVCVG